MINYGKVSIITPTYNSERFIKDTYDSLRKQTYSNWEWLVTDDCSTDSTLSILEEISAKDSRVKISCLKHNSGAAVSRNNSLSISSGDFIAFLDSDDLWEPSKLEKQLIFMQSQENIDFSFTSYQIIDECGTFLGKIVDNTHDEQSFSYEDMLKKKATLGCSTVLLRAATFNNIKMPNLRTGQDYALWLSLLRTGHKAYLLKIPLSKYRICANSISRNKFKKSFRQWQIYRKIENINFIDSLVLFLFYAWRAVFRK
ncbi:glycosyltransferase family 2 protein [Escherichia albertii]|uniref:glycosyltransferase family 2 protein n=1 Tax=Escherichia albertii TaxID=208962 RepID=UPI000CF612FC|nr:glycosyltransferase family A protein [Escherichia albertii]